MNFASPRAWVFPLGILLLPVDGNVRASPPCAATIVEFRTLVGDPSFPLRWQETTMDDGKPMVVSILERNGSLHLEFIKTGAGLWAESAGIICTNGKHFETRFASAQIRFGPAANWVTRIALGRGGHFTFAKTGSEQLRIATGGWSGNFSPGERQLDEEEAHGTAIRISPAANR
jgi:hypothetical protein